MNIDKYDLYARREDGQHAKSDVPLSNRNRSCLKGQGVRRNPEACLCRPWLTPTTMSNPTLRDTVRLDLLVPVCSNAGEPFTQSQFHSFERFVVGLTGGVTRFGEVEGLWRNGRGIMQRERSRLYSTVVSSDNATRVAAEIDRFIRRAFDQDAAFVTSTPTRATAF